MGFSPAPAILGKSPANHANAGITTADQDAIRFSVGFSASHSEVEAQACAENQVHLAADKVCIELRHNRKLISNASLVSGIRELPP
jgi:hypothetical protein